MTAQNSDPFQLHDLVELRSEAEWNRSLFRITARSKGTMRLSQLDPDKPHLYIGVDTAIDESNPDDVADLMVPRDEILREHGLNPESFPPTRGDFGRQ